MTDRALHVVGSGRMGRSLASRLRAAFERAEVHSARALVQGDAPRRTLAPATWLLAVTDRAIKPVAMALTHSLCDGDVVLHLAGMLGPEELSAARGACADAVSVGSLHPLAAVSSCLQAHPLIPLVFLFEGDRAALSEVERFCLGIGATVIVASGVDRARYHAAAALVVTGSVALAQGAAALLAQALTPAIAEPQIRAALASLLCSVAHNVLVDGAQGALASPLLREDTDTVARHLWAMESAPTARAAYLAALTGVLVALESGRRVSPETLARLRALIEAG